MAIDSLSINPVPFDGSSVVNSMRHYGDNVARERQINEAKAQREMDADLARLNAPPGKPYEKDVPLLMAEHDKIDKMMRQYHGDKRLSKYDKAKLRGDIDKATMQWKYNSAISAEHAQQNWKEQALYSANPDMFDPDAIAARQTEFWDLSLPDRINSGSKMPQQATKINTAKEIDQIERKYHYLPLKSEACVLGEM